jgi:hypothetical protein
MSTAARPELSWPPGRGRRRQALHLPRQLCLDSDAVVFWTDLGTKLAGAAFGSVVFEIDGLDEVARCSVERRRVGCEHRDQRGAGHPGRSSAEPAPPALGAGRSRPLVALRAESITGRRVMRK